MDKFAVNTTKRELSGELHYRGADILKYQINYPEFKSDKFTGFIKTINHYYNAAAKSALEYCKRTLYKEAAEYFDEMTKNNYPVHEYEYSIDFTMTETEDCALSLYFDEGRYTGGANGTSIRSSDNWNLTESRKILLHEFYPNNPNYRAKIQQYITELADDNVKTNNANYFEDYKSLIKQAFDDNNFYFSKEFLTIFYQEITIAPHSSGNPTFDIPLSDMPVFPVACGCR